MEIKHVDAIHREIPSEKIKAYVKKHKKKS